jgi:hypothetical protein
MPATRSFIPLLLVAASLCAQTPAEEQLVQRYCLGCHNSKLNTAGLSLESLSIEAHPGEWEKVVRRLRARQMPPAPLPRPDEASYQSLVRSLENTLDRSAAAKPNPGRTDTFRRLNRNEYRNAIRDLLALDVDVSSMLPADESSRGFDNMTVGDLSPTLLESYLNAARKISRLAIGIAPKSPGGDTITLRPDLTQEEHFDALPIGTRGGTSLKHTFPVDADYDFQIRLARDRNEHVEGLRGTHEVEVLVDNERVKLFTVKPPPTGDHQAVDQHLSFRLPLKAGPHQIAVTFPKQPSLLMETERQPYPAHFNMDRHPRITPALYSLSINGPYQTQGPGDSPSRRRIFSCKSQDEACAKTILLTLSRRAYRRPVTERDIAAPLRFFREARATEPFDSAIEMALRAVLVSPEFLFRVEQDPEGVPAQTAYRITDLQLATRLSFFLWSSIPDDELLTAAANNTLHTPAVLNTQVKRMLADPRSRALIDNFAAQWLHLRNLDSVTPDMRGFPDFDDNLRQAFRRETELFFDSVLREDRSVLTLLKADYTFLNERLAKHYGIPNIYGGQYRRVALGQDRLRGGLLRQGSILTVTSYATRTSPVIRGKWILDNILGIPPPPPPPNVPALKENGSIGKTLTLRERLAEHRKNPACFGCHQLMDPIGFSMENYDAVGRWRQSDDIAGGLPDGSKFDGIAGLEASLLQRPELFATTFTEKLLSYSLGRGIEAYDAASVRKIVRNAQASDYRISSFILGIVASEPFQQRRTQ